MHFLYFVPGLAAPVTSDNGFAELLDRLDLRDVLSGTVAEWRLCERGPNQDRGQVFVAREPGAEGSVDIGYYPDRQRWIKCADGAYWLGYWLGSLPAPDALQRKCSLDTMPRELGDGNTWMIPIARYWQGDVALPETFGITDDGTPAQTVDARYGAFYEAATKHYDEVARAIEADKAPAPNPDHVFDLLCLALGHTYRVGKIEILALGLLNTGNLADVSNAVIGLAAWNEIIEAIAKAEKKRESADTPD